MEDSVTDAKLKDLNLMMNCDLKADGTMWAGNCWMGKWSSGTNDITYTNCYDWWHQYYYPEYYPDTYYVHYHHAIEDKGKKAIEIVKALMDSKVIKVNTVKQFVDVLDKVMKLI